MDSFNSIVRSSLNEVLQFLGEKIIVGNKTVLAVVNSVELEEELTDGGLLRNRGITAVISSVAATPEVGSTVIFKGKGFRIITVNEDSAGIELVCVTDAK